MSTPTPTGADIIRHWLKTSPFVGYLSIGLVALEPGKATLRLPYDKTVTTIGTVVHGGAIATLLDSAGAAAAWSDAEVPANVRGTTVSLSISYLAAADDEDVLATARVLSRGRSLVYLDIDATTASGKAVAKGLATYKIG
ncbi:MAG TPA: PaaI family thioesterase [Ktedonobacterales bacterium]